MGLEAFQVNDDDDMLPLTLGEEIALRLIYAAVFALSLAGLGWLWGVIDA